jgi:hypothetical protein
MEIWCIYDPTLNSFVFSQIIKSTVAWRSGRRPSRFGLMLSSLHGCSTTGAISLAYLHQTTTLSASSRWRSRSSHDKTSRARGGKGRKFEEVLLSTFGHPLTASLHAAPPSWLLRQLPIVYSAAGRGDTHESRILSRGTDSSSSVLDPGLSSASASCARNSLTAGHARSGEMTDGAKDSNNSPRFCKSRHRVGIEFPPSIYCGKDMGKKG